MPDGKQCKIYVGKIKGLNGKSIDDAKKAENKYKVLKTENRLLDIKADTKMTFNELTEWYLNLESVKDLASYATIKISLKKFNSVFGDKVISRVKKTDIENYQSKRLKKGKAPGTVDHEVGKAKTMIFKAFDDDDNLISEQTLKMFKKIKKTLIKGSDVRDRIISPEEFDALVKNSEGHTQAIITMAYYTGMRRGEILNLTWDKVDLANRMIRLDYKDTKNKQNRNVPICDEVYNMLLSLPNRIKGTTEDNHVFLYKGSPIKDIRAGIREACKKAGIKYGQKVKDGFIFHDFRHTFNTNMRKAGVAESVIMEITGHSTREMFDRYNTVDEDDTRTAVRKLEGYFAKVTQKLPKQVVKNKNQKADQLQPLCKADLETLSF